MDPEPIQPILPQQPVQISPLPMSVSKHKSVWTKPFSDVAIAVFVGLFACIIFISSFLRTYFGSNPFLNFLSIFGFLMGVLSIIPILIFIVMIKKMIKNMRERKGNFTWPLIALVLNAIPLIFLIVALLGARCFPGAICF